MYEVLFGAYVLSIYLVLLLGILIVHLTADQAGGCM